MLNLVKNSCKQCHKEFSVHACEVRRGGGMYCSKKCGFLGSFNGSSGAKGKHWKHTKEYKKKLSLARMGVNNPAYKTGSTKRRRAKTQRIKNWRKKVFKRDDFTCQECDKRGGDMNAHHNKFWTFFPKERFKISNGITLCKPCHKYIHWVEKLNGWENFQSDMARYITRPQMERNSTHR